MKKRSELKVLGVFKKQQEQVLTFTELQALVKLTRKGKRLLKKP